MKQGMAAMGTGGFQNLQGNEMQNMLQV